MARTDITIANRRGRALGVLLFALLSAAALPACSDEASSSPWTKFVPVAGQPDPVPEQWVSTPEGKIAHSIVIPNPVPKDSGYRSGMSSKEYFEHLCKTEAGEFIYRKSQGVKGLYFMRPPNRPTDDDLRDRYKLEAPEIERTFQLRIPSSADRAVLFVDPPWRLYEYAEEPARGQGRGAPYLHSSGRIQGKTEMHVSEAKDLQSRYGLLWRGIKRAYDRELAIAGSEWIVIDLQSNEVLAVERNFGRTGFNRNSQGGIWWLNAINCPQVRQRNILGGRIYDFVSKVLVPLERDRNER